MSQDENFAYEAYIGFAQHAEANSWTRFYNFLVFNTILILAWSTIYSQTDRQAYSTFVLALFCIVGASSGFTWYALGKRGREFASFFLEKAAEFETSRPKNLQVCNSVLDKRKSLPHPRLGSYGHLVSWPLGIAVAYGLLLIVTLASHFANPNRVVQMPGTNQTDFLYTVVVTLISVATGGLITWLVAWWYYKRAGDELRREAKAWHAAAGAVIYVLQNPNAQTEIMRDGDGRITGLAVSISGKASITFSVEGTLTDAKADVENDASGPAS